MNKISIIIPVYNASKYIDRCLESIAKQTYRKLEILFVDDCGTDDTIDKIKNFSERNDIKDLKIKILHHNYNRGVAAARNTGLDAATGEYIYSIDADDYIEPMTIEKMIHAAEENRADIIGIEWFLTFEKNERHMYQPEVISGKEMFRKMCYGVMRWNLWLFLIKRKLIEDQKLRFTENMNMGEDMMMMMKLSLLANSIKIIHKPLYHYRNVSTSVSKVWSGNLIKQITNNVMEVERYAKGELPTEIGCLKLNLKLPLLISSSNQDYETWTNWFPEANKYIKRNPELPLRTKLLQTAAANHHFWYVKLYYTFIIKFIYGVIFK